jgi:hypothetical protein
MLGCQYLYERWEFAGPVSLRRDRSRSGHPQSARRDHQGDNDRNLRIRSAYLRRLHPDGGWLDKFPLGAAFAKGLTLKMGQTHMHKYMPILLERIERGEIDPSFIITHRIGLEDAPTMYRTFRDKHDSCVKVVMKPAESLTREIGPCPTSSRIGVARRLGI